VAETEEGEEGEEEKMGNEGLLPKDEASTQLVLPLRHSL
jgi:hypothetical protein